MKILEMEAKIDHLSKVLAFVDALLEEHGCSMKTQMQVDVAIEEIFVNVASYAYGGRSGPVTISCHVEGDKPVLSVSFTDEGIPYNPLEKPDPDTSLPLDQRDIGGLGIYMVKKSMDDMKYEYKDGKNILTISKAL